MDSYHRGIVIYMHIFHNYVVVSPDAIWYAIIVHRVPFQCLEWIWLNYQRISIALRWRHNGCDSVSNHQPRECLLRRLIRRTSKKTSKLRVTGLCVGNSPGPVNSPHKGPVTRKIFPFDDVIMWMWILWTSGADCGLVLIMWKNQ